MLSTGWREKFEGWHRLRFQDLHEDAGVLFRV